jgi:hypothetical protein
MAGDEARGSRENVMIYGNSITLFISTPSYTAGEGSDSVSWSLARAELLSTVACAALNVEVIGSPHQREFAVAGSRWNFGGLWR